MYFKYEEKNYSIERYPSSDNKSLRAWSAADEYLLKYLKENNISYTKPLIYNDRFGFLSTILSKQQPNIIINYKSQEKSLEINLKKHGIDLNTISKTRPLDKLKTPFDLVLIKIPKSLDLFRFQLDQLHESLKEDTLVICAFMTKYFSAQILKIAEDYFELCEQSIAWKKSRLLFLKKKRKVEKKELINSISYSKKKEFKQYYGVFSAKKIDQATLLLIQHLDVRLGHNKILDLACGNGILAHAALANKPNAEIHLLDDSELAIASCKINIDSEKACFHYNDTLDNFENNTFDLIISNPPFHFEHETNIEIALNLFKEVKRCLKKGGSFQLVTSNHLNSKTHLNKLFHKVNIIAQNEKFVVYHCV